MKNIIIVTFISLFFFFLGWQTNDKLFYKAKSESKKDTSRIEQAENLSRYSIEKLSHYLIQVKHLLITDLLTETSKHSSYKFVLEFAPDPEKNHVKKVTGRITIPKNPQETKPAIVIMLRGYVDKTIYKTGDGSRNAANFLSENGYITIAPDFLGYGESDTESSNIFEARFQTYTTVLALLNIFENEINSEKIIARNLNSEIANLLTQRKQVFIWGHSNGGQIALTVLAITSKNYPTVLWAPVTKPFPYSVLYYTDESVDEGKFIRKELAKFEKENQVDLFSFTNYLDKINTEIQIHQGERDNAVPVSWNNEIVMKLKQKNKNVSYYTYKLADHNMRPEWENVMRKTFDFYESKLNNTQNLINQSHM
ncbi:MAG: alpha/beta fold hydrolase [Patescibacteria group bacterium]|nr:alpha/beta fold hydrolase [Patescibacteria group bacterium]